MRILSSYFAFASIGLIFCQDRGCFATKLLQKLTKLIILQIQFLL